MTISRLSQRVMKRVRAKLRAASPCCHWCAVLTNEPPQAGDPNGATVDHLKPRRECQSVAQYHAESNLVLACFECNSDRDKVDIALMKHQREEQARLKTLRSWSRRRLVRSATRA